MTQYGRYVFVQAGTWRAYTLSLGGYEVDLNTALGRDTLVEWLSQYTANQKWDPAFFDEGALIDDDARLLMVSSQQLDVEERAGYLRVLRRTWPSWEIRWALHGLDEFARHLGLEVPEDGTSELALRAFLDKPRPRPDPKFASFDGYGPPPEVSVGRTINRENFAVPLTVLDHAGDVQSYAMRPSDLYYGPQLLELLPPTGSVRFAGRPWMGAHLDVTNRSVGVWTKMTYPHAVRKWSSLWPQWTLELWDERWQEHVDRSRGALPPQDIDEDRGWRAYSERLDDHWQHYVQDSGVGRR